MRRTVAASAAVLFLRSMRNRNGVTMKQYIIRRVLLTIPLLVAISFVCFVLISLIPSDPAEVALRVRQIPVISGVECSAWGFRLQLCQPAAQRRG